MAQLTLFRQGQVDSEPFASVAGRTDYAGETCDKASQGGSAMHARNPIRPQRWLTALLFAAAAGCGGGDPAAGDGNGGAPGVASVAPANNAVAVPLDSRVSATFSVAIDPATVNAATFTLAEAGLTPVAGSIGVQGSIATFTPGSPLAPSTTYVTQIKGGATGVKNASGTPLPADVVWHWTTVAVAGDVAPPTVVSTVPVPLAPAVCVGQTISARFSEAIDPATINSATFTLAPTVRGSPLAGVVAFDPVTRTATFAPAAPLLGPSVDYTARLRGGASGVKDLAGNPLAIDHVWTFTTGGACA